MTRVVSIALLSLILAGCAGYALVEAGTIDVGGLRVTTSGPWNAVPRRLARASRSSARVWTQSGVLLDRLILIPAVPDGDAIFAFKARSKSAALPTFKAGMNPREIEELTESSVTKLFGEGEVIVETHGLRPHRFGNRRGILFNMELSVYDGPDYGGLVGAFSADGKLYMVMFLAARPHYFDVLGARALAVIKSARL